MVGVAAQQPLSQQYEVNAMVGLALHTSTPELGLSLSDFAHSHHYQTWDLGRALSSQLHSLLQEFMTAQPWPGLNMISVCIGPGGFTGTRIGVATARTLAQQLDIPLFGISSLAAIAHHVAINSPPIPGISIQQPGAADIAVTMPAKRGAVYGAIYHWTGETVLPKLTDTVIAAQDWHKKKAQWPQPLTEITLEIGIGLAATTPSLLQIGHHRWQQGERPLWRDITPFYGQHPVNAPPP